ncbi:hypothetical protein ACNPQM_33530 [Streptomyces sp. NPDC056231]|uniref:hypothetical protein n=1 Tax=Streptomyces sp. NPDC056231 TaxID=3345755 RepID=UPI003AAF4212
MTRSLSPASTLRAWAATQLSAAGARPCSRSFLVRRRIWVLWQDLGAVYVWGEHVLQMGGGDLPVLVERGGDLVGQGTRLGVLSMARGRRAGPPAPRRR